MEKQKLVAKLTSRKFWSLLAALVGSVLLLLNFDENSIAQITAIIGGFGSIMVYIFSEASVDIANINAANKKEEKRDDV